jgi:hypothetical protein
MFKGNIANRCLSTWEDDYRAPLVKAEKGKILFQSYFPSSSMFLPPTFQSGREGKSLEASTQQRL